MPVLCTKYRVHRTAVAAAQDRGSGPILPIIGASAHSPPGVTVTRGSPAADRVMTCRCIHLRTGRRGPLPHTHVRRIGAACDTWRSIMRNPPSGPDAGSSLAAVATVLTPAERAHVDAAGEGLYRTMHRESVDAVLKDLRTRRVDAVLVSVARCDASEARHMATMVREFPRVPALALLASAGAFEERMPSAVLALGQSGVRRVIDVRQPAGWRELRAALLADHGDDVRRMALAQLSLDLAGAPADCWKFFEAIFAVAPAHATVRGLAEALGVLPSTLMSRFFRAGLPTPKQYLACARLVRAARLFENGGFSIARVATHLEYSSPQSFGRHVRALLQLTAGEFRRRYDAEGMLHRFREELVLPHALTLHRFRPLAAMPGWISAPPPGVPPLRCATRPSAVRV